MSAFLLLLVLIPALLDCLAGALGYGRAALATTGATYTNLLGAIKRRYDDAFLGNITWSKGALGAMIRKVAWSGQITYMMRTGNSPARSASFSKAKTKSESATYGFTRVRQPLIEWSKDYGRATIDGLLMATAGDKMGSVYDKFVAQLDGIMDATMSSFSAKVYRGGWGMTGKIGSTTNVATTTLQLDVIEDAYLFEIGEDIGFAANEHTGAMRNAGSTVTITAINHNLGQLTTSAAINTVTGTVAGDYIFKDGDRDAGASPVRACITGLNAWACIQNEAFASPSGGENFNGLDRSLDGRLVFAQVDGRSSPEEGFLDAATAVMRTGGKGKFGFCNPTVFGNLVKQGMGRYRPARIEGPTGFGFDGVVMTTNYGDVQIYPDLYCPRKFGYLVDLNTIQVYSAGTNKVPNFITHDGNKILRQTDDDGVESRCGYYAGFACDEPIRNAAILFE